MKTKKFKIWGFRKWLKVITVDRFSETTYDNTGIYLEIKEKNGLKIALMSTNFQVIGYTEDMSFAFKVLHNLSLYTLKELFDTRGNLESVK